jgi:hypothetical protein
MVSDYNLTRDALARLVGLRVLEDHREDDPAIGRRGGMTWIGDNSLELGEPTVPGGAVDRFVRRFGSHMSSFAVQVVDTDATVAFLEQRGVRIASRVDDVVFTDPATTGGVVIEWYGGTAPNDPRFGTIIPAMSVSPLLDVRAMAFGGAVVIDPTESANRLADLFGTSATHDRDVSPGSPYAWVHTGDVPLALFPIDEPDESRRLWGHAYARPQTSNLGVLVPNLGVARSLLTDSGVPLVRATDELLVVDPVATGGIVVVVIDRLLSADPRSGTEMA